MIFREKQPIVFARTICSSQWRQILARTTISIAGPAGLGCNYGWTGGARGFGPED